MTPKQNLEKLVYNETRTTYDESPMHKLNIRHLDEHFSNKPTRTEDLELGEMLARYIGPVDQNCTSDTWVQVVKALRTHGLTIVENKEVLCDGEEIPGGLALFLSQFFLANQSFAPYVSSGKLKGRQHVDGLLEFLDSSLCDLNRSKFSFEMEHHPVLACMVLSKISANIVEPVDGKQYYWEWTPSNIEPKYVAEA